MFWAKKSLATTYSPTQHSTLSSKVLESRSLAEIGFGTYGQKAPLGAGSTIGAGGLDFRVRDGNGYDTSAMVTRQNKTLSNAAFGRRPHVSAVLLVTKVTSLEFRCIHLSKKDYIKTPQYRVDEAAEGRFVVRRAKCETAG